MGDCLEEVDNCTKNLPQSFFLLTGDQKLGREGVSQEYSFFVKEFYWLVTLFLSSNSSLY